MIRNATLCITLALSGLFAATAGAASLNVTVENLQPSDAPVEIHLFGSEETWLKNSVQTTKLTAADGSCSWEITDLPEGTYGIYVYQDVNGNGKMDRNFMGMPTEPYGFSNDAKGKFGPASWSASKFEVKGDTATTLHL